MGYQHLPSIADRMVGHNIRRIRLEKGITVEQMASCFGEQAPRLPEIEAGLLRPSAMTLLAVADALNCKLSDLFSSASCLRT